MQVAALAMFTVAMAIILWAWANDALRDSQQERIDHEFQRIARRLSDLTIAE